VVLCYLRCNSRCSYIVFLFFLPSTFANHISHTYTRTDSYYSPFCLFINIFLFSSSSAPSIHLSARKHPITSYSLFFLFLVLLCLYLVLFCARNVLLLLLYQIKGLCCGIAVSKVSGSEFAFAFNVATMQ
jgi:hypothetical protein